MVLAIILLGNTDFVAERFAKNKGYLIVSSTPLVNSDGDSLCMMYDMAPKGYVIVPFSKDLPPVLAWSTEANRTPERSTLEEILELDITERLKIHKKTPNTANRAKWTSFSSKSELDSIQTWGPWLYTNWGQGEPYNRYCPIDPETGEKCPSGCTIVAALMIMNYWEYPHRIDLTEEDSYWSEYTDPPIWIDAPPWDMDTIIWVQEGYARPSWDMLARLMRAVGVNVEASYSSSGTGAFCNSGNYLDQWGYRTALDMYDSWSGEVLRRNLRQGKPMFVAIYGPSAGHAIVADGLKSTGEFHLNMGWNGAENGWYNVLDDHFPTGYNRLGWFIHDITAPLPPEITEPLHLTFSDFKQKKTNAFHYSTDVDVFTFDATSDSSYIFFTNGPHFTFFEIYDSTFTTLLYRIEGGIEEGYGDNAFFNFRPPEGESGRYYLVVGSYRNEPDVIYSLFYMKTAAVPWPYVEMLYPVSGTRVYSGDEHTLYYYTGGEPAINYVALEYSTASSDGPWSLIADSLRGGHFVWTIPDMSSDVDSIFIRAKSSDGERLSDPNILLFGPPEAAIDETIPNAMSVHAYPNPFNSTLNIDSRPGAKVTIYNAKGEEVSSYTSASGTFRWHSGDSPTGVYLVNVTLPGGKVELTRALLLR